MWTRALAASALLPAVLSAAPSFAASPGSARAGESIVIEGSQCTQAFMLQDTRSHRRFEMTAGHCMPANGSVIDSNGQHSWPPGRGPRGFDRDHRLIGSAVYSYVEGNEDFALIELAPGVRSDPTIPGLGGVTGVDGHRYENPEIVDMYGQGLVVGQVAPGRSLVVSPSTDGSTTTLEATGPAAPVDSGAPVVSRSHLGIGMIIGGNVGVSPPGDVVIVRLGPALVRANSVLHLRLTVVRS